MTTKRIPLNRTRKPLIDPETLALFIELENVPLRQRKSREFEERAYALAVKLGLNSEHFCSRCSVLDRERQPYHPEGYARNAVFWQVRRVREQLLEAVAAMRKQ